MLYAIKNHRQLDQLEESQDETFGLNPFPDAQMAELINKLIAAHEGDTRVFGKVISDAIRGHATAELNLIGLLGEPRLLDRFLITLTGHRWLFDYMTYAIGSAKTVIKILNAMNPANFEAFQAPEIQGLRAKVSSWDYCLR